MTSGNRIKQDMNPIQKQLEEKEKELNIQFDNEKNDALAIEEQIKNLQVLYQQKVENMTKLQGAFSLLKELSNLTKTEGEEQEKK